MYEELKLCAKGESHFRLLFLRRLHSEGENRAAAWVGVPSGEDEKETSRLRKQQGQRHENARGFGRERNSLRFDDFLRLC